ncbi:MAG: hypothetical protein KDA52_10010 [Planctomycetaceae bacterium]|nr:hypothetical protein [Planctomycetaceae bacterium]
MLVDIGKEALKRVDRPVRVTNGDGDQAARPGPGLVGVIAIVTLPSPRRQTEQPQVLSVRHTGMPMCL